MPFSGGPVGANGNHEESMNKGWMIMIVVAGILSLDAAAQTNNPPGSTNTVNADAAPRPLARGDIVVASLSKTLDAGKAKAGDEVVAQVSESNPIALGGAKLVGHISNVQSHTGDKPESRLVIVFDKAVLKDGREVPFNAVIARVTPPQGPPAAYPNKVS